MAAPTSVDADAPILEAPERRRDAFVDRFFRAAKPLGSRSGDAYEAAAAPAHLLADRVRLALTPYGEPRISLSSASTILPPPASPQSPVDCDGPDVGVRPPGLGIPRGFGCFGA
jgi:hypothetical protein